MKNIFIHNLNEKDVTHCTTNTGLYLRRTLDKPFKRLCKLFTNANIIHIPQSKKMSDEEYFHSLGNGDGDSLFEQAISAKKNNIILERYPELERNEPYIFVCNHTCPEDIETVLNIIDRNAYLVLGSLESLRYNPEMYLSWLNGMIPFDIMNDKERKQLSEKMERVLKTNSILIFPEGSHNYHPCNLINPLFDGPVNLSLKTGKKIVLITMVKDHEQNISYIDVSNPIDLGKKTINIDQYYPGKEHNEKYLVKSMSSYLRDRMATAVYYCIERHFNTISRKEYDNIGAHFRKKYCEDAYVKLHWKHDVFDAEYLVKRTAEQKEYEEVVHTLVRIMCTNRRQKNTWMIDRNYFLIEKNLNDYNVAACLRRYFQNKGEIE